MRGNKERENGEKIAVYVRWFYKESECPLFIGQMFLASKYV